MHAQLNIVRVIAVITVGAPLLAVTRPAAADDPPLTYAIVDLGLIASGATSSPGSAGLDLNDSGMVVGASIAGDGTDAVHAFRWTSGIMTELGALGEDRVSRAVAIDTIGIAVGESFDFGDLGPHAVRWVGSAATDLGSFSPRDLNDAGVIVGEQPVLPEALYAHAVRYLGGSLLDLGTLGGRHSSAYAVNGAGDVVGLSFLAGDLVRRAFLWHSGSMTDLGTLGGARSCAFDVNDTRQVVGIADTPAGAPHAFRFDVDADGTVVNRVDLGVLGGAASAAYGVNGAGDIVGTSDSRAFLYAAGVMVDLNTLINADLDWQLGAARAISDGGRIVGSGVHAGQPRAFLLCLRAPADLDGDGAVGVADFLQLLADWGPCTCVSDIDGDGMVGAADFLHLLGTWGCCCAQE